MSHSLSFNEIDLSTYGLRVKNANIPDFAQENESQLIQDISYSFPPKRPPKIFQVPVIVSAADRATLDGYLDSIKSVIVTEVACKLAFDSITSRYWMAKQEDLSGDYHGPNLWIGNVIFRADDPTAYAASETDSNYSIDADPKTVIETAGGTTMASPVYTLAAGENLTDVTILVENLNTGEELSWEGSLANGEELEIDSKAWTVKKEGTEDMSSISGQFPRLQPGANSIKVTGFSNTGSLNIKYRARYL